jgi:predicted PurR-regulated permease PerM
MKMNSFSPNLSLRWSLLMLASSVIVLMGVHLASAILNPILVALLLALIVTPVYGWLLRQRLPTWVAIGLMLVGAVVLFGLLFFILGASANRLSSQLGFYSTQIDSRIEEMSTQLNQLGLTRIEPSSVFNGDTVTSLVNRFTGALSGLFGDLILILVLIIFFLVEGPLMVDRLRAGVSVDNPRVARLTTFGESVIRQFGLRGIVNLITGASFALFLFFIGVDFPLLWGVLTFFLSYIPYLGIILAGIPAVLLALAEFGIDKALLVIAGLTVVNVAAENLLAPTLMGRGLNVSPTVVFLSFTFWFWLLGAPGAFLAMPLTIFVALMLDTYPETRWLANVIFIRPRSGESDEPDDQPAPVAKPVDAAQ